MIRPLRLLPVMVFVLLFAGLGVVHAAEQIYVSELDLAKVRQDWGTAQKDRSVENRPMTIGGVKYDHGVGTHAASELVIDLAGAASRFSGVVGFDDEAKGKPNASPAPLRCRLVGDGKTLWSADLTATVATSEKIDVDLTGIKRLSLRVIPIEDRNVSGHVDWADATITYTGHAPVAIDAPTRVAEILTPPSPRTPRINGPVVFGVRPGSAFLYTIPATGDRPMTFAAEGLPAGLTLDATTGRITGAVGTAGEYRVTLRASNALGQVEKPFRVVVGDTIALTPPLGWNSWNCWGEEVDQDKVLRSARALASSGLADHGWSYVNIDDTWQGVRGGPFNAIQPDPKRFPDIKALADEVHGLGLKIGIYSSPWVETYGGRIGGSADNAEGTWTKSNRRAARNRHVKPYDQGQFSFAANDARQWAAWGIDYLKYDWGPVDQRATEEMAQALRAGSRDVVLSLSNNAAGNLFGLIDKVSPSASAWRTTGDIVDRWSSVRGIGFSQDKWAPFQRPGHYNDADMLVVGRVGWGKPHQTKLTPDEQYTHVTLWSLLGTPLLIGCDLEKIDPFTLSLLTNDEVLAVNQDPLCRQATTAANTGDLCVMVKDLADGSKAVGLFNRGLDDLPCVLDFAALKMNGRQAVRDCWRQKDLGGFEGSFKQTLPPHGVILLRIGG